MALKEKAEEYFSNLNQIANRMCADMNDMKQSYENLWQTLPYEEQQQILNQTIIKPEISVKYPINEENNQKNQEYAEKIIMDDNYAYRDEHSAPFSFRTASQRDLTIFASSKGITKKKYPTKSTVVKLAPVAPCKPEIIPPVAHHVDVDSDELDSNSLTHILPKTGLDLLDNW